MYEMLTIIPSVEPKVLEQSIEKIKEIVQKEGGEILAVNVLGEREFAYPIQSHHTGYYIMLDVRAEAANIASVRSILNLTPGILRHQIVKKMEAKKVEPKRKVVAEAPPPAAVAQKAPEVKMDIDLELGL